MWLISLWLVARGFGAPMRAPRHHVGGDVRSFDESEEPTIAWAHLRGRRRVAPRGRRGVRRGGVRRGGVRGALKRRIGIKPREVCAEMAEHARVRQLADTAG